MTPEPFGRRLNLRGDVLSMTTPLGRVDGVSAAVNRVEFGGG